MDNVILEEIKAFAVNKLKNAYGYCGEANGPDKAFINSDDGNGKDIKIVIEIESSE